MPMTRTSLVEKPMTPASLGYRMPAEWELHEATWISWPHNRSDWPGKFAPIAWVYGEIVRKLAHSEEVKILVNSKLVADGATRVLESVGANLSAIKFYRVPTDRVWTRDYGPVFLRRETGKLAGNYELTIVRFGFNGWAKYHNHKRDDA
ncbi:MAG: agmatine deiminase family protein, partial [Terriglobia bacterium]